MFFSDSGSTSVEWRVALGYWRYSGETRHRIIVLEHSYHGTRWESMSMMGSRRGPFTETIRCCLMYRGAISVDRREGRRSSVRGVVGGRCAAFIVEPLVWARAAC